MQIAAAHIDVVALAREGLTLTVREMAVLAQAVAGPGFSVLDHAAALNVQKPVITRAVDRLDRDGLARRLPDQEDRRRIRIYATERGRLLISRSEKA